MKLPRNAQLWLPDYLRTRVRDFRSRRDNPGRVWLAIADHFEPLWLKPDEQTAHARVAGWSRHWPEIAARHQDSAGRPPKYTFYFPQEEYRPAFLDPLASMTAAGIADVEVHIHHGGEGERAFLERMSGFIETLHHRHGLLRKVNGRLVFGFIHGNWALDNSRPDGICCGLNNEITLLRDLGCYADFTMPSGNSPTQSRLVNTIYWVTDDPEKPRSFDTGIPVAPGVAYSSDLLMIPGPLGLRWKERLVPRLETGEIAWQDLPTPYRVSRWLDLAPRIGDDIFLKLYTHGAQERNAEALLRQGGLDSTFRMAAEECRRRGHQLYFVSTWEMRQAVDLALEGAGRAALLSVRA
jgi:hypothetical protein